MKKILVTGGCGYIGSHTIVDLVLQGYDVVCADSFVRSDRTILEAIEEITGRPIKNYDGNLCDAAVVNHIFETERFDGVIHFAAYKSVPESVAAPLDYYENNLDSLIQVLRCCQKYAVKWFVFSSSASVYGDTQLPLLTEESPLLPAASPYGHTKQIGEAIIAAQSKCMESGFVSLRYFNPSGAHTSALIGELPTATYNVTPRITATAAGRFNEFLVYGNDYPTRDGTCVRDYVHVMDIAAAHTKALQFLEKQQGGIYEVFNLGTGTGVTVMELIAAFEAASGVKLNYRIVPARPGDVTVLCADASKARRMLGWEPRYNVFDMMATAWKWELSEGMKLRRG